MSNLFDEAMNGIGEKIAIQEIRKVIRGKDSVNVKLEKIVSIVETYQDYAHRQAMDAEDRELKAEEEAMRRQRLAETIEDMVAPLNIRRKGQTDGTAT
jgi:uncharacterized protein YdaL